MSASRIKADTSSTNQGRVPIFNASLSQLPIFQIMIIYLKLAIGTGMISLGSKYVCGLFTTTLISTFVALVNFYTLFLFVKVSWKTKCSSLEEMWIFIFGEKTVFIPCFCSVMTMGTLLTYYISYTIQAIQNILNDIYPTINTILSSQFTIFWLLFFNCFSSNSLFEKIENNFLY